MAVLLLLLLLDPQLVMLVQEDAVAVIKPEEGVAWTKLRSLNLNPHPTLKHNTKPPQLNTKTMEMIDTKIKTSILKIKIKTHHPLSPSHKHIRLYQRILGLIKHLTK